MTGVLGVVDATAAKASLAGVTLWTELPSRLWPADDPLRPGPDEARQWAEEELAKPAYGKSFLERFFSWLSDWLSSLFQPAPTPVGGLAMSNVFAILAVLGLAALAVWLLVQLRRRRFTPADDEADRDAVLPATPLAAAEYRARARAALAGGDASTAMVEAFRAVAAQLLERHVLDEARDRTAREFAAAGGEAFPPFAERARHAAAAFDATLYGARPASAQAAQEVLDLDEALQGATPREVDPDRLPAPLAVPR